jgi:hypothetical protein
MSVLVADKLQMHDFYTLLPDARPGAMNNRHQG